MPRIDPARLAEIEAILADPGISGVPLEWVRLLCETVRAAWAERDEAQTMQLANGTSLRLEAEDHRETRRALSAVSAERSTAREQVRQLREALRSALDWWKPHVQHNRVWQDAYSWLESVLEATKCP